MNEITAAVDTPNPEWTIMSSPWDLIDDLMGGTASMKAAGEKWLPREDKEKVARYRVRLNNSVLFERFSAAVESLRDRPFRKRVQIRNAEKLPDALKDIEYSVDDECRDLTVFLKHCMDIAIQRGMVHMLTDYPAVNQDRTVADERAMGLRPMIVAIDPRDLFAWQYRKGPNGKKVLTQIRIAETSIESDGSFGSVTQKRVRVIYEDRWELWQYTAKSGTSDGGWVMVQEGPWTLGKISLVTVYLNKTGYMTAKCPLEALAWLNLAHYQSMSDHRNNLRFARCGIIFGKGFSDKEREQDLIIGVNHSVLCGSPNADMKIVEHSGSAVQAGENELRHLEDQMDVVAKGPLIVRASGNVTATGHAIDEGKSQCELQSWVDQLAIGFDQSLEYAHEWVGEAMADDVSTNINKDFGMLSGAATNLEHVDRARARGDIGRRTYLECLKLYGVLVEDADVDQIIQEAEQEPSFGMIGRPEEDDEDEDEDQDDRGGPQEEE